MVGTSIKSLIDLFKPKYVAIYTKNENSPPLQIFCIEVEKTPPLLLITKVFPSNDGNPSAFIKEDTLWIRHDEGRKG